MSAETGCRNHSRVFQDLRAVTLQEPQEDETRVDTVLGRESIKNVQGNGILGNRALVHYGLFRIGLPDIKLTVIRNGFDLQATGSCRAMNS
jgi:hypothetical protein